MHNTYKVKGDLIDSTNEDLQSFNQFELQVSAKNKQEAYTKALNSLLVNFYDACSNEQNQIISNYNSYFLRSTKAFKFYYNIRVHCVKQKQKKENKK